MRIAAVLFAAALATAAYAVHANSSASLPDGWSVSGEAAKLYRADVDTADTPSGEGSVVLRRSETSHPYGDGHLKRTFAAGDYAGKRVRISMRARYEGDRPRHEGRMYIGIDGGIHVSGREVDRDWHLYQATVTLAAGVKTIAVGVALDGTGTAKVDSIEFEVLGDAPPGQRGASITGLAIDGEEENAG